MKKYNSIKNNAHEEKQGINPVAAGAIGLAVTAVATVGAAVMLSDKSRRKKVGKTLNQLGKKGKEMLEKQIQP